MGKKGDWKQLGYVVTCEKSEGKFHLKSFSLKGDEVGSVSFEPNSLMSGELKIVSMEHEPFVKRAHRRLGLNSAMYDLAEKESGLKTYAQTELSSFGRKFWEHRNKT